MLATLPTSRFTVTKKHHSTAIPVHCRSNSSSGLAFGRHIKFDESSSSSSAAATNHPLKEEEEDEATELEHSEDDNADLDSISVFNEDNAEMEMEMDLPKWHGQHQDTVKTNTTSSTTHTHSIINNNNVDNNDWTDNDETPSEIAFNEACLQMPLLDQAPRSSAALFSPPPPARSLFQHPSQSCLNLFDCTESASEDEDDVEELEDNDDNASTAETSTDSDTASTVGSDNDNDDSDTDGNDDHDDEYSSTGSDYLGNVDYIVSSVRAETRDLGIDLFETRLEMQSALDKIASHVARVEGVVMEIARENAVSLKRKRWLEEYDNGNDDEDYDEEDYSGGEEFSNEVEEQAVDAIAVVGGVGFKESVDQQEINILEPVHKKAKRESSVISSVLWTAGSMAAGAVLGIAAVVLTNSSSAPTNKRRARRKRSRKRTSPATKDHVGLLDLPFELVVQILAGTPNPYVFRSLCRLINDYLISDYFASMFVTQHSASFFAEEKWRRMWFSPGVSGILKREFADHVLCGKSELLVDFDSRRMCAIPTAIGNLAVTLTSLNMPRVPFGGKVPIELGLLVNLKFLDLSSNFLTGKLDVFMSLRNLKKLNLAINAFTGPIPPEIGNLNSLDYLSLSQNLLTGTLNDCFANLSRNTSLIYLDNNAFEGCIPPTISEYASIYHLFLNDNNLSGTLAGIDAMPRIHVISLQNNKLSGTLSENDWNNLTNLVQLNLSDNQLEGPIPASFGGLIRLELLNLAGNRLDGGIPEELGFARNLESLNLSRNELCGSIPLGLGSCTRLYKLNLSDNHLTGTIPHTIVKSLRSLQFLHLNDNDLEGKNKLPSILCTKYDKTKGPLPQGIRMLRRMKRLYLKGNKRMKGVVIPPDVVRKSVIWRLLRENEFQ
ncbi:UNVERIFIED_CONTAM: hypothetical protein HDU68_012235 [Siphonaria sp. JEL0065]|nr:hypothetical protein HDU68_012235 [Siphonaria sp. JEL0065]